MIPKRIQLSRRAGFNLQAASRALNELPAVNCARPSMFGNPFRVNHEVTAARAVSDFELWLTESAVGREVAAIAKKELRGKNLACWCAAGQPCHTEILLKIANP